MIPPNAAVRLSLTLRPGEGHGPRSPDGGRRQPRRRPRRGSDVAGFAALERAETFTFDLSQHKTDTRDWEAALLDAVRLRAAGLVPTSAEALQGASTPRAFVTLSGGTIRASSRSPSSFWQCPLSRCPSSATRTQTCSSRSRVPADVRLRGGPRSTHL